MNWATALKQDREQNTSSNAADWATALQNDRKTPQVAGWAAALKTGNTSSPSNDPWTDFSNKATQLSEARGFPANVTKAQAALESARGTAAPGNNYFGIKGNGNAGTNNMATQEYGSGGYYGENSNFGAYNSPEDSINAYLDLVINYPGVRDAMSTGDSHKVLQAIEANGYATSPTYVQDVENTPEFQGGTN